jgi:5-carboxymethyl-2-hydroxymuconate isomerase
MPMPHLTIEYSANLDGRVDMHSLCRTLLSAAVATGIFDLAALRVRALPCDAYAIADEDERNSFVDVQLRIAQGRDAETKKRLGDAVFAALSTALAAELAEPHCALSLEIREMEREQTWRTNAILERLKPA